MDTLDEIKQILKENAIQQAKNDKLFAELRISQAETDAKFKETDAKFKETDAKFKETDVRLEKLFAETDAKFKETDARFKETDARLEKLFAKTDAKLKEVGRQLGDIGHSSGDAAEEFFYNALEENKFLGKVKFDEISKNIKAKKHRLEDEYDIFMENGNSVAIVEVKHKVRKEHITKLISNKAENFRVLFPDYTEYKLFVGIAGLAFDHKTEEYAAENGIVVLKQKGEVMQIDSSQMRAF
jgi:hypothetical protein